ncbi:uncharacterized protein RCC_08499 [Ramularia collo-cygni]|uniref:Uncharacterized protein n=1 Tax=Ramularia collo-cygni TaxID=112498 RepID=A0A2D3V492_9PEZI|nr:uncharacterized protein RCC_08499 [Ramularia collo-cygni]CZT22793.1 uncharacterized protein RCC_08499 [Ramularia collo-cygni]
MSAPLPSPSANHAPMQYFPSMTGHQQHLPPTSHPLQQAQQQHQQQQQQPAGASTSMAFVGQRGDGGGVPSTAPFLNDFNLLAEAAKRAQMACLSRDLGDIGL